MNKGELMEKCVNAESNFEASHIIDEYIEELTLIHPSNIPYVKADLQECVDVISEVIIKYKNDINQESAHLKSLKGGAYDFMYSKMVILIANEKISLLNFLSNYIKNKISLQSSNLAMNNKGIDEQKNLTNLSDEDITTIRKEVIRLIDTKFKVDPNKKTFSRAEACELLNISNRKLTTLVGGKNPKIKPVSYANKPYTFNIEELERYRNNEM